MVVAFIPVLGVMGALGALVGFTAVELGIFGISAAYDKITQEEDEDETEEE